MKKRILSIILTLCMVLCIVPTSVFAEGVTSKKVETQQELVAALADDTVDIIKLGSDIAIDTTLNITRTVTLDLVGYMLEIKGSGSVFIIKDGGHLTLEDSDLTSTYHFTPDANGLWKWVASGGTKTVHGGVIYGGTGTAMYYYTYGGGVLIEDGGRLTVNGGSIVGCSADSGGGVKVECGDANGTFTMNGGAIIGCVADCGGGVETDSGGEGEYGIFAMNDGVIDSCVAADGRGGGVYASGPFTMGKDAAITNCKATEEGSGLFLGGGLEVTHTLNGTITSEDTNDGDYIFANNAQVTICANANIHANITLAGGTIEMNANATFTGTATVYGGSVYTPVANANDFTTALNNTGVSTVLLKNDITFSTRVVSMIIRDNRQLTLDLNGYVLDLGENPISVGSDSVGSMTIMDSRPNEPHKFTPDTDGLWVWDKGANMGTETVLGGVITSSESSSFNAISVSTNGRVIMNGGNIVGHKTGGKSGGAVHVTNGGKFTMTGGSIVGCYTTENGGAVAVGSGTFEMAGGVIKSCKAAEDGGAVRVSVKEGTFTMTGGSIEGCTAKNGSALCLYGTMNAGGGTVNGTVVLDVKNDGSKGIIQGSGTNATRFNGDVTNYGTISHGTFSGTVTLGNSTLSGKITGGTFNGQVTTDSGGEADISGGVFNNIVTINRGEITNGTFNKDVVVDNALGSFSCTTLTDGTYNGLIINKSAYAAFAGAHSLLGIVETKPSSRYSNDRYRTVTFDPAGGTMEYPVRYFLDDGNISDQIKPDFRAGYFFAGWYNGENKWNHNNTVGEDDLTLTAHWTVCDHSGHTGAKPTCTTSVTCTACGGTVAALGHNFSMQHDNNEHWNKCSRCDAIDGKEPHDWDSGVVTVSATCIKAGKKTYTCTDCGFEKIETIDAKGHNYGEEWQHDAAHHWHSCGDCDAKDSYAAHSGGTATCTEKAVCGVCGEAYGETDPKNHSNLVHFPANAATTAAEGNTEYWHCEGCGKYFADAAATKEITKAAAVTAKLPNETKSPRTGGSSLIPWLALLFIGGGVCTAFTLKNRKSATARR